MKGYRFLLTLLIFSSVVNSQTQAPSINSGVTFQWEDVQTGPSDPATIKSITVDGVIYRGFVMPSQYQLTRLGPDGDFRNGILENGLTVNNNSANPNWISDATAAFQDKNLNHYFTAYKNGRNICNDFTAITTTDAQIQSLIYNPGIPSNEGGIIAITERNANNCYYISVFGIPAGGGSEQFLGDTFVRDNSTQWGPLLNPPPSGVDYWNAGRVVENNGTIGIALFSLEDLAPVGSIITRVDLTASTVDHGDGKFFILQSYAVPITEVGCMDNTFSGTVGSNSVPVGSTYSIISGPTPAGLSFTFNTDGSYSYLPAPGNVSNVTFEYEVCLPSPNQDICESSIITLSFDTTAPTFNEVLPADITIVCDTVVPVTTILTATDDYSTATVIFNETRTDGACDNAYSLERVWTATDECGLTTVHTQTITVEDTTVPTFNEPLPTNTTVECDAVPTAETLTATDNCGTATVTFNETRTDGACDNTYSLERVWTATEECGLTTVHTQTITVEDTTAPTFNEALPTNATVECDNVPAAETLTAADNCGTATVTFTET
ncbi:MAG: hypothetical protein L3J14_08730, partial [Flavobacteriaceae bacterium]|nr:hypothetical protein [Flavobacteriaceae bacterium]